MVSADSVGNVVGVLLVAVEMMDDYAPTTIGGSLTITFPRGYLPSSRLRTRRCGTPALFMFPRGYLPHREGPPSR